MERVEELAKTLLEPVKDVEGARAKSAGELSSHVLDVRAFNALYSICCYPDIHAIEGGLLPLVGESIGKILSERDLNEDPLKHHDLDPNYFDSFHPAALEAALAALTEGQREVVYNYTVGNRNCAEALTLIFYDEACEQAMELQHSEPRKAAWHARNAIALFARFKRGERNLYLHFKDVVMNIVAGEPNVSIIPFFIYLIKNYRQFAAPENEFEKYVHFHVMLITKLVCMDYSHIQSQFEQIKGWIVNNLPEDEVYIQILEMVVRGQFQEADDRLEEVRKRESGEEKERQLKDFYHSWYIAVKWLIRLRR